MATSPSIEWTAFHARIHHTLRSRQLLQPHQSVLVAVSGGQDSLCLAKLLLDLQSKWQWHLAIAHCDHGWRLDSAANAEHVNTLAQAWGLPYYQAVWQGGQSSGQSTSEAAARQWRYDVLVKMAQTHGFTAIATGHTASDRAETLLYNLIRGSGADGLQALTWQRALTAEVQLIRPLLDLSRTETAQFCQDFRLPIWEDTTNADLRYARNRIRQEIIPYLKQHLNPQTERHLAHTAELLQAEVDYLETVACQEYQAAKHRERSALHRLRLQPLPLAIQRRVIRQFLEEQLSYSPNFDHIEKVVALLTAPNRSCSDPLSKGTIAQVEGEWLVLNCKT